MDATLERYLKQVDHCLRPMPLSERTEILAEIKNNMAELQTHEALLPDEILQRFGPARQLACGFVADGLAAESRPGKRSFLLLAAFYGLVGVSGLFVLPVCSVLAVALVGIGVVTPLVGLAGLITFLLGLDVPFLAMQLGPYTPHPVLALLISIVMGVLLFVAGRAVWGLMMRYINSVSKTSRRLR